MRPILLALVASTVFAMPGQADQRRVADFSQVPEGWLIQRFPYLKIGEGVLTAKPAARHASTMGVPIDASDVTVQFRIRLLDSMGVACRFEKG